ncbi:MAG: calcium/sodium antiporter, partial [Alistipes sp.]|nr:calcium/sodium antiporter [Alistipes sp.]
MEYIYLLACLGVIVFSANWLVTGSVVIAKRFKISDFVIGAVIVGVGTSFPEMVVSTLGAIDGNSAIAIGNVVGSNIFNIMGILGLTAMVAPVAVTRSNKRFDLPFCLAVSVLALLLVFNFFTGGDAVISRADSFVLLAVFLLFMYLSLRGNKKSETQEVEVTITNKQFIYGVGKVISGLTLLILASDIFLDNAVAIAKSWGVNDAFISITLIACGTSMPELAASLAAAAKKNTQLALGNVVGSNIFNLLLILGVGAQITP